MDDDDYSLQLFEDGDSRTNDPHGEDYADNARLFSITGDFLAEWVREESDGFRTWTLIDGARDDAVKADLSGYVRLENAVDAFKRWLRTGE